MAARSYHPVAITSNFLAALFVAALLGLGIHVNLTNLVVEGFSTNGFPVVNVDQSAWNIGCTVVGTAVGILVSLALSRHDDFLTRRAIQSEKGLVALYLKPLTAGRGAEQIQRGQFHPDRVFLVFLTLVATLSSAATVAIFGIHNVDQLIFNPAASYPLSALNDTYFESDGSGAVFPLIYAVEEPILDGFLYRSAYIGASIAMGDYSPYGYNKEHYLAESGPIGDTVYGSLNTQGIGLNTTSYTQFSGLTSGFNLPNVYTFSSLNGYVFGTNIDVQCTNATASYNVNYTRLFDYEASFYKISSENNFQMTLIQDTTKLDTLIIGSTILKTINSPVHVIVVPSWISQTALVCECTYSGREFLANVSLGSNVSPLVVDAEVVEGPEIGDDVKTNIAQSINGLLSAPGGGSLVSAWTDANFNTDGDNNTSTLSLLESILGQTGEAYLSLLRQNVEIANTYSGDIAPNGANVTMSITIAKIGGGAWGWLSVYGLLLVGCLIGVLRTCRKVEMASWEVQDPVKVLETTMGGTAISSTARLRLNGKIELVSDGSTDDSKKIDLENTDQSASN